MESAITISSSESSVQNSTSIESLDPDAALDRLPINGDPKQSYNSSCTPTTFEKVDKWLKSLDVFNRNEESCSSSCFQSLDFHSSENHFLHEIISLDLNAPNIRNDTVLQDQSHAYSNESSDNSITSSRKTAGKPLPRARRKMRGQATPVKARKNSQQKQMREWDDSDSAPENVKKQELCSYLQLMKPTDKKTVMILQNRRSVRVKNLSLMQQNRDLEKKLKERSEDRDEIRSVSKCSHSKSTREVGNDKKSTKVGTRKDQPATFRFPNPTGSVTRAVRYFDETEQEDWFKEWKEQPSKHATGELSDQKENQKCVTGKSSNYFEGKFYILESRKSNLVNIGSFDAPLDSFLDNRNHRNLQRFNTNNGENNVNTKHPTQIIDSVYPSFSIPTPPSRLVETIRDFDVTVEENKDIFTLIPSTELISQSTSCSNLVNNNRESSALPKAVNKLNSTRPGKENFGSARSEIFRRNCKKSAIKSITKSETAISTAKGRKRDRRSDCLTPEMKSRWKNLRKFIPVKPTNHDNSKIELIPRKQLAKFKNQAEHFSGKSTNLSRREGSSRTSLVIRSDKKRNEKSTNSMSDFSTEYSFNVQSYSKEKSSIQCRLSNSPKSMLRTMVDNGSASDKFRSERWKNDALCVMQYQDCEPPSTIMAVYTYKTQDQLETLSCTGSYNNAGRKNPFISQIFVNDILKQGSSTEDKRTTRGSLLNGQTVSDRATTEESRNSSKSVSSSEKCSKPVQPQIPRLEYLDPATFISFDKDRSPNSFYRCLNSTMPKRTAALEIEPSSTSWASNSPNSRQKRDQHLIQVSNNNGRVINVFYRDYNLILCQETLISFWTQTALGNVLGAQNMWIKKGSIRRLSTNKHGIFKEALEMVVSTESSVAYIELWTKEHQSAFREVPVADVFAIVYYWKNGQTGLDKKVLQLENIKGFADDVHYSILTSSPKIIVSWHIASNEVDSQKTFVHCYQLTADFQAVCNISKFEAVEHYVSSLHNIQGF
ncbi:uncharacterized protein LOC109545289 isoform X2 [Dendroctonus ponderosae]|uniref:Uncharacterized protein n=1 Tax=Dendroctonus ponderosae TaxID=77166 RepID=A0AAR5QE05_DENPD|nr:uncharacterized protein LOC109545289 isoform X2 [Dendroctonus ponderosae]